VNSRLKRAPRRAVLLVEYRRGTYHALLACGHLRRVKRVTYRPLECLACLGAAQAK
jgi:hypothetical protein